MAFLVLAANTGYAQEVSAESDDTGAAESTTPPDPNTPVEDLTEEQLMYYLINEKEVAAGIGFINGQLGDPMSYILEIWGDPEEQRKTGILGSVEILYLPDPNTAVVFTGQEAVESISIKGDAASLLRTRRGARFGMPPLSIVRLYPHQKRETVNNRFEFPELGIDFHFIDNKVDKIVVYSPD